MNGPLCENPSLEIPYELPDLEHRVSPSTEKIKTEELIRTQQER